MRPPSDAEVRSASKIAEDLRSVIFDEAVPRSKKIRFDQFEALHVVKVATYCSVLEQGAAILSIIESGLGYHSYALLRGQMESLADIINLNGNPAYLKYLEYQYEEAFHRQFVAASKGNPYLRGIAESPDFQARISECGSRLRALKRAGFKRLEPKEKLNRAGLRDEYEALYGHLNDHAHGGIRALMARHFRLNEGDFELVAFNHLDLTDFDAPLQTALDAVLRGSVAIHEAFKTGEEQFFLGEIQRLSYAPADE